MLFNRFSVHTAEVHQIAVQGIDSIGAKWGAVAGAGCRLGCEMRGELWHYSAFAATGCSHVCAFQR